MEKSEQEAQPAGKNKITIARRVLKLIAFFLVNYVIFELLFSVSLWMIEGWIKVLPFLHTPRDSISPGAGLLEYFSYQLSQGVFPFFILGIIILLGLFGGRIFCGWACPTGAIQDVLAKFPQKKSREKKFAIKTDRALKKFKIVVFVLILIIAVPVGFFTSSPQVADYEDVLGDLANRPVSIFSLSEFFFAFFPSRFKMFVEDPTSNPFFGDVWIALRIILFFILCVISAYYPRFYCRVICPYGALMSIFSEYSVVRLGRNPVLCPGRKECGVCEQVCPLQIRILDEPWQGFTGGGECILCLKCKEKCPHNAIEWRFG